MFNDAPTATIGFTQHMGSMSTLEDDDEDAENQRPKEVRVSVLVS